MNDILKFIDNFRTRENNHVEKGEECVRHLFRSGYCYYFAKMLEIAYPGGKVCLTYPYGHFIYWYNDEAYDIEGQFDGEAEAFVPEEYMPKEFILDFKHLPNEKLEGPTKEQIETWFDKISKNGFLIKNI